MEKSPQVLGLTYRVAVPIRKTNRNRVEMPSPVCGHSARGLSFRQSLKSVGYAVPPLFPVSRAPDKHGIYPLHLVGKDSILAAVEFVSCTEREKILC